jgi:hypothetical protein
MPFLLFLYTTYAATRTACVPRMTNRNSVILGAEALSTVRKRNVSFACESQRDGGNDLR